MKKLITTTIIIFLFFPVIVSGVECNKRKVLYDAFGPFNFPYEMITKGTGDNFIIINFNHPTEPWPDQDTIDAKCALYELPVAKEIKITEIKSGGLVLIRAQDDSIQTLGEAIRYAKSLARFEALGVSLSTKEEAIKSTGEAGRDMVIEVNGFSNVSSVVKYPIEWP